MRSRLGTLGFTAIPVALALITGANTAKADITIYEKDGTAVWTAGRVASHLQYVIGDGTPAPEGGATSLDGFGNNGGNVNADGKITRARIAAGWVGTNLGFGISNQVNEDLKVKAYIAVTLQDITNDGNHVAEKMGDWREAFGVAEGSWGSVLFGRALSTFASALGGIQYNYSWGNGLGHPCTIEGIDNGCGSNGAGGLYPVFASQITYATPDLGGFGLKVGLYDPSRLPAPRDATGASDWNLRTLPRVEGELSYQTPIGADGKFIVVGQGVWQSLGRVKADAAGVPQDESTSVVGGVGAVRVEASGFKVGLGAWTGKGMGTNLTMQHWTASTDETGELRSATGGLLHAMYSFGSTDIGAGAGTVALTETDADKANAAVSLFDNNVAFHVVAYQHVGPLVLGAEFSNWTTKWQNGEKQNVNFMGVGANYTW